MTGPVTTRRRSRQKGTVDAERVMDLIRAGGGRASTARRVIVDALNTAGTHRSAEELAGQIHRNHPEINQSTVYRGLDRLEDLGVAYHTHLGHGPAQWHLAGEAAHHHLTCHTCGQVIEADPNLFVALRERLAKELQFSVDFRHFAITGTCHNCQTSEPLPTAVRSTDRQRRDRPRLQKAGSEQPDLRERR